MHVFCQCGSDLYSFSALGTGSSTENCSGEAGQGQKGMPFITAFRTLDDMAELSTTDDHGENHPAPYSQGCKHGYQKYH